MVAIIATVAAKAGSAAVTHPQRRFLVAVVRRKAIVVDVVVAARNEEDVLLDHGVLEVGIVRGRCGRFGPVAYKREVVWVAVLGQRDVDERQVHVDVCVFLVFSFEGLGGCFEPVDHSLRGDSGSKFGDFAIR